MQSPAWWSMCGYQECENIVPQLYQSLISLWKSWSSSIRFYPDSYSFFSAYRVQPICIKSTWNACLKCRILGPPPSRHRIPENGEGDLTYLSSPEFSKLQNFQNECDLWHLLFWNESPWKAKLQAKYEKIMTPSKSQYPTRYFLPIPPVDH